MGREWTADVLGAGYEATTIPLEPDHEGDRIATLVRSRSPEPGPTAVLYVHGYDDYFFQTELAEHLKSRGHDFYAIDLHKYGRSLLDHQTPNMCTSLDEYRAELDEAARIVLEEEGHRSILGVAHSTGGLIVSLWLADRRTLPVAGLVLNSPFLEIPFPAPVQWLADLVGVTLGRIGPYWQLPRQEPGYGESLHASRHGRWRYDLRWKPLSSFPIRLGWLAAIRQGQRRVHRGLWLPAPVLVLCSSRFARAGRWKPELQQADAVLDPARIARWAGAFGEDVACIRVPDAMHDVFLSVHDPARKTAFETLDDWLESKLP